MTATEAPTQPAEELKLALDRAQKTIAANMPESGFSLNWTMIDTNGIGVQVTMRAAAAWEWPDVMRNRAGFVEKALAAGWKFPEKTASAPQGSAPQSTNGNGSSPASDEAPFFWKTKNGALDLYKGKLTLCLRDGVAEPGEIACPLHGGKILKRKTNDNGAYLSHRDGESWCNGRFEHI